MISLYVTSLSVSEFNEKSDTRTPTGSARSLTSQSILNIRFVFNNTHSLAATELPGVI